MRKIIKLNKSFITRTTNVCTWKSHHGTKSHPYYMIIEILWRHALSQRINNHQISANIFNDHFSLTSSFMAKYLMSMCLFRLLLLFLVVNTAIELSQYNLNGLKIKSTILSPDLKFFNHTLCEVASKYDTNSASSRRSNQSLLWLFQDITPPTSIEI